MKNEPTPALTPKLRFPEFRDQPSWEARKLGDAALFYNGRAYKQEELLERGKYKVLRVGNFFTNNSWYYSDLELEESKYCNKGDLLYAWSASFGPRIWMGEKTIYHYHIWKVEEHQGVDKAFLFITLEHQTEKMKAQSANGLGLLHITKGTIERWDACFPKEPEQQKIADCLSSVDELIAAQARKLDALKTHKKGLMQQLFPREGETQPRLRFPEFQNAGEWDEVDFADAIFFQEGPGIMAVDFHDEGVPLVRLSGLAGQSVSLDGCNYLDPDKVEQKWSHFRLEVGDILVSCSASFGRPAIVTEVAAGAVFYTGLVRFKAKDGRLCIGYLEVFMGSPSFLRQAESFAVGGGIKHFGPTHLRQMKVPLPPNVSEQQRIADCLTSLDALITAEAQTLETLKTHKQGLMQQLFPSMEEVKA